MTSKTALQFAPPATIAVDKQEPQTPQSESSGGGPRSPTLRLVQLQEEETTLVNRIDESEQAGKFIDAQSAITRLKEVRIGIVKLQQEILSLEYDKKMGELRSKQQEEVAAFLAAWDRKMRDFDCQSERILEAAKERLRAEYEEIEKQHVHRSESEAQTPRYSGKILSMKKSLELLVRNRDYLGAENMRRCILEAEKQELARNSASNKDALQRKMSAIVLKQKTEMKALAQRIKIGKDDLLKQRRDELDRLLKSHQIVLQEIESAKKVGEAKTAIVLDRQGHAVATTPRRLAFDGSLFSKAPASPRPVSLDVSQRTAARPQSAKTR
eukprot:ANDGO_00912.mRNA.1 hypothetical protein (macronuclear)